MKRYLVNIRRHIYWIIWGLTTLVLVSFTTQRQLRRECRDIHIHIKNQHQNFFLEKEDIKRMMTQNNKKIIIGLNKKQMNLRQLERWILNNNFVKQTSVSTTHTGDLIVEVIENRPIARVFEDRHSFYIDNTGKKLPLSRNYTSRSLVVINHLDQDEDSKYALTEYLNLINYISNHSFWKKQIAEIEIDQKGRVFLYPQVGKQKVSFGYPKEIAEKFLKLDIFFKKILPSVGWNKYNLVKLEFNGQIVCE